MPDIFEIHRQILAEQQAQTTAITPAANPSTWKTVGTLLASPVTTIKGATADPLGVLKGLFINTPLAALKTIGVSGANLLQALTGATIPLATDEPIEGFSPLKRFGAAGNAVWLGLPDVLSANIDKRAAEVSATPSPEQKFQAVLGGIAETALMDVLPGRELKTLVTGRQQVGVDDTGNPIYQTITGENIGEAVGGGALKSVAVSGMLKAVTGGANPIGKVQLALRESPTFLKKTLSAGEIAKGVVTPEMVGEAALDVSGKIPIPPDIEAIRSTLSPEVLANFQQGGLFSVPETRAIYAKTVASKTFADVVAVAPPGTRIFQMIAQAVKEGALDAETLAKIADDHGIPIESAADMTAAVLLNTPSFGGKTLEAYSKGITQIYNDAIAKAAKGDTEALRTLVEFTRAKEKAAAPVGYWGKFSNATRNVETFRRSMMVGQLATAVRNALAQGITGAVSAFEHVISGTIEAGVGILKGDKRSMGDYYGDLLADFHSMVQRLTPAGRKTVEALVEGAPLTDFRLKSGYSYDIGASVLGAAMKGIMPKGAKEWSHLVSDVITTPNRLQEMTLRRLFFRSRLEGNIKALGLKDLDAFTAELTQETLRPELRVALADAEDFAMKQTYSYNPQRGPAKTILDIYKKLPILTAIFPPFPRFLYNQWRWQMERSPTIFFNIFEKSFRNDLFAGAENGFASRQAARQLGQATAGIFMLNAAWVMRNSPSAGPKYYQFAAGVNNKGEAQFDDIRAEQPFVSFAFFAEIAKAVKNNTPINLSANEIADAIAGVRRLGELPIFAPLDILRSFGSSDPASFERAIKQPIGQYFASFFTPLRTLDDLYAAAGSKEAAVMKDVEHQELTGPVRANIPDVAAVVLPEVLTSRSLSPRTSVFKGEPITSEYPGLRQFSGLSRSAMTEIQRLIAETPGVQVADLIGEHDTSEANNLVAEGIGKILTHVVGTRSIGDYLAEEIRKISNMDERKKTLQDEFARLREDAVTYGEKINPRAFFPKALRNEYSSGRITQEEYEHLRRELIKRGAL